EIAHGFALGSEPVDDLVDDGLDPGAARVDAMMCFGVRRAAHGVEPFEFRPVRGERPPAIGRHAGYQAVERYIQPDRDAISVDEGSVLRIDEGAAARRHDRVARSNLIDEHRALDGPEV